MAGPGAWRVKDAVTATEEQLRVLQFLRRASSQAEIAPAGLAGPRHDEGALEDRREQARALHRLLADCVAPGEAATLDDVQRRAESAEIEDVRCSRALLAVGQPP